MSQPPPDYDRLSGDDSAIIGKLERLREIPQNERDGDLINLLAAQKLVDDVNNPIERGDYRPTRNSAEHKMMLAAILKAAVIKPFAMPAILVGHAMPLYESIFDEGVVQKNNCWTLKNDVKQTILQGGSIVPLLQLALFSQNCHKNVIIARVSNPHLAGYELARTALELIKQLPEERLRVELPRGYVLSKADLEATCLDRIICDMPIVSLYGELNEERECAFFEEITTAVDRLISLLPNNPAFYCSAAHNLLQMREENTSKKAAEVIRKGLAIARDFNHPYAEAMLLYLSGVAGLYIESGEGKVVTVEDAERILDAAKGPRQRCWKWLPASLQVQLDRCKGIIKGIINHHLALGGPESPLLCMQWSPYQRELARRFTNDSYAYAEYQRNDLGTQASIGASFHARITCAGCGKNSPHLQRCGRCKSVSYCSRDCQLDHWPSHKGLCKKNGKKPSEQ